MVYKSKDKINLNLYFIHKSKNLFNLISNYDKFYSTAPFNEIQGIILSRFKLRYPTSGFNKNDLQTIIETNNVDLKLFSEYDENVYFTYFINQKFNKAYLLNIKDKENSKIQLNSIDSMILFSEEISDKEKILQLIENREKINVKKGFQEIVFSSYLNSKINY